jgi:hypothetical protein
MTRTQYRIAVLVLWVLTIGASALGVWASTFYEVTR